MTASSRPTSRRRFLKGLSVLPAGLAAGTVSTVPAAQSASASVPIPQLCRVAPQAIEGPYYLDPGLVRDDITEGRTGVPLELNLQVVTADCAPVQGARVDVWHADAEGLYSGFAAEQGLPADAWNRTFLRGTQVSDASGAVRFRTIYPGWYAGRTTHIHYKVLVDARTALIGQIFLPDALSEFLYRNIAPYDGRGDTRDTRNVDDWVLGGAGEDAQASVREQADRYVAAMVIGIDPEAEAPRGGAKTGVENAPGAPGTPFSGKQGPLVPGVGRD